MPQARSRLRRFQQLELLEPSPLFPRELVESAGLLGLNCGSGGQLQIGWLNTDVVALGDIHGNLSEPDRIARLDGDLYYLQHDATEPFPLEDASFEWVYSEHFIEHLTLEQGIAWLKEVRRLLRAGGHVRISTPDLRLYVEGYLDPDHEFLAEHFRRLDKVAPGLPFPVFDRPAWMVNQIFYRWQHQWIYDFDELKHAATLAGFDPEAVRKCAFRDGRLADVYGLDLPKRNDESLYVEIGRD